MKLIPQIQNVCYFAKLFLLLSFWLIFSSLHWSTSACRLKPPIQHSVFFVAFDWLFGWVNEPFSSKAAQCPVFLTKICLNITSLCKDRVWEFQSLFFTVTLLCKCVYGAIKGKEIDSDPVVAIANGKSVRADWQTNNLMWQESLCFLDTDK